MPRHYPERSFAKALKADKSWSRKCNRTRFATPVDAQIALGSMPDGKVARKCPVCGGYHLVAPSETLGHNKPRRVK